MQQREKKPLDFSKVIHKQRWSESDARSILSAYESSGMSLSDFCHEYRIQSHRMSKWERKLEKRATFSDEKPVMVPLRVVDKQNQAGPIPWLMEIELQEFRIRVSNGVNETFLIRTLRLLKELSC